MNIKRVLAFDFGASSGRAMIGEYDGSSIKLKEVHRFTNDPVIANGTMYWDVLRLFYEIKQGLLKAKEYETFDSIGIDTWGVDFGLLDQSGKLLENPVHYRDIRTSGMVEKAFEKISKERLYEITGNQIMQINTLFQLLSLQENRLHILEAADTFLLMPDLLNYMLTGVKASEYSICSTTQMLDAKAGGWSEEILHSFGFKKQMLTEIIDSGTRIGSLHQSICEELGIEKKDVIAVAGHDTQCALLAVPAKEKDFLFISCGTWSLVGTELEEPLMDEKAQSYNLTNEGGYKKKAYFLKNIIGLWLIQESRRQWEREGNLYEFIELEDMAREAAPFKCFIDPDAPEFVPSGNIPERIREFCKKTNQKVPQSVGEIVRCIHESLAFKYRVSIDEVRDCTKKNYNSVYMVGGGTKSKLLCEFTASACKRMVTAGPVEATAYGNIAIQLMTSGDIKDVAETRAMIANLPEIVLYEPDANEEWDGAFERFKSVLIS